jgi:hypothetical protein
VEIRNYATALAIIAGLDNLLVRQLPAWKHLPAKIATLMEDLEAMQVGCFIHGRQFVESIQISTQNHVYSDHCGKKYN